MPRLWARIINRHRIERQATRECARDEAEDALIELCRGFDIPSPLWLDKHVREYEAFGRTRFMPDHFMEDVSFQRLEIEYLDDDDRTRRSNDPRNQFDVMRGVFENGSRAEAIDEISGGAFGGSDDIPRGPGGSGF